jgi:DNA-binding transcriptional ArsR family regulator
MTQSLNTFQILAEPSRRVLLEALLGGEVPVKALVDVSGLSQPVVSKHLKILRDAGLVGVRPEGQRRLYSLRTEPLRGLDDWLEPYRRYWSDRLDALEAHLAETAAENSPEKGGERQ